MLPPTIANTADRDTRARLEQARNELTEEHLNPLYLEAVAGDPARRPRAGRADVLPPLPRPLPASTSRGSRRSAAPSSTRPSGSTRSRWTACCASASASGSPRPSATTCAASSAARTGTRRSRPTGWCPALRGTLVEPRDRPRRAGQRPPRRRGAADEEPARVLRADRDPGQGDARDPAAGRPGRLVRALPRGRAHRALRVHEPRPARWRRSGSATTPSPRAGRCSSTT